MTLAYDHVIAVRRKMIASVPGFAEGYRWRVHPDETTRVITICPSRFPELFPETRKCPRQIFPRGPWAPFELEGHDGVISISPAPKVDAAVISSRTRTRPGLRTISLSCRKKLTIVQTGYDHVCGIRRRMTKSAARFGSGYHVRSEE